MKKNMLISVGVFISLVAFIFIYNADWSVREKTYQVSIPIDISSARDEDLCDIENQVFWQTNQYCKNAYLTDISWNCHTKQEFLNQEGLLIFNYNAHIGNWLGREKYKLCEIIVNLSNMTITSIRIHGNIQMGGSQELINDSILFSINDLSDSIMNNYEIAEILNENQDNRIISNIDSNKIVTKIYPLEMAPALIESQIKIQNQNK